MAAFSASPVIRFIENSPALKKFFTSTGSRYLAAMGHRKYGLHTDDLFNADEPHIKMAISCVLRVDCSIGCEAGRDRASWERC